MRQWSPSALHEGIWRNGGMTPFVRYPGARWTERPHSLPEAVWMRAEKSLPGIEALPNAVGIPTEVSRPTLWGIQQ